MNESSIAEPVIRLSHYLHSGHIYCSNEPTIVTTILSSCVSVCLYDPHHHLGGINHYLLPYLVRSHHSSLQFGNVSTKQLIEQLIESGCQKNKLVAKVFGGATINGVVLDEKEHLGLKNVRVALNCLDDYEIPVVSKDVGGRLARKLIFHTDTGDVWVKKI